MNLVHDETLFHILVQPRCKSYGTRYLLADERVRAYGGAGPAVTAPWTGEYACVCKMNPES